MNFAQLAKDFIDNDSSLMISNSDQFVDIDNYLAVGDGLIMTMFADDNKRSFIISGGSDNV